jgi:hypothetical protein
MKMIELNASNLIATLGTLSTLFFGIKASNSDKKNRELERNKIELEKEKIELEKEKIELEKEKITLEWEDLETACTDLSSNIESGNFKPDIIFIPDIKDGATAFMIKSQISYKSTIIPIIVGMLDWKITPNKSLNLPDFLEPYYDMCETKKWRAYIPKNIINYKDKNILILYDIVLTGDFGAELKIWFNKNGFDESNVKLASIITTSLANHDSNAPDFYWKEIKSDEFYFPWGKGR